MRIKRTLVISFLFTGIFFCLSTITQAASFQGTWITSKGVVTLHQSGNKVHGAFGENSRGKLLGLVSDNTLSGTWRHGKTGFFFIRLNPGGDTFSGKWGYPGQEWSGSITGKRSAPNQAASVQSPNVSISGKSLRLDDFTVRVTDDWKRYAWKKDGKRRGWRLRYQPNGVGVKKANLSISFAAEPSETASRNEMFSRQNRIRASIKKSFPKGFGSKKIQLAGNSTLILRYHAKGNTVFLLFPYSGSTFYDIYVWVRGKVREVPKPAEELLATLTLPGQEPYKPGLTSKAVVSKPAASQKAAKPAGPKPLPKAKESGPSPVPGACYVAGQATSGRVLTLHLGMPLAEVDKRYHVTSYGAEALRIFEDKIPCLAYLKYTLNYAKGVVKEKAFHGLEFKVDKKAPGKPVTEIVAKIKCEEGLALSRRLFAWYAEAYGPPVKKVNKMDAVRKLGSLTLPGEFWHYWHLKSKDGRPLYLEIKRRNDFEYYVITLRYRKK